MNFGSPWERNEVRKVENKGVNTSLLLNVVGLVQRVVVPGAVAAG